MLHLVFLPQGDNVEELVVCWQEKLFSQVEIKNGFPFEPEKWHVEKAQKVYWNSWKFEHLVVLLLSLLQKSKWISIGSEHKPLSSPHYLVCGPSMKWSCTRTNQLVRHLWTVSTMLR